MFDLHYSQAYRFHILVLHREYVNLVSDDECTADGVSLSPTPPPISPLTPPDERYYIQLF